MQVGLFYQSQLNKASSPVSFCGWYKTKFKQQVELFPQDKGYRAALAKDFGVKKGKEYLLRPIIGLQELTEAISSFTAENYMPGVRKTFKFSDDRDLSLVKSGKFRANLHCHSKYSDGTMSVEEILNQAAKVANINAKKMRNGSNVKTAPFIVAIADHDTVEHNEEVINLIKKNPYKYRNLRVVLASEITAKPQDDMPGAHILVYGLHPKDKAFVDSEPKSKGFKDIVSHLSTLSYGAVGIAHPARLINKTNIDNVGGFFDNLFGSFKSLAKDKAKFVENHYQSYYGFCVDFLGDISAMSKKHHLKSTGGLDSHENSILTATKSLPASEVMDLIG